MLRKRGSRQYDHRKTKRNKNRVVIKTRHNPVLTAATILPHITIWIHITNQGYYNSRVLNLKWSAKSNCHIELTKSIFERGKLEH